MHLILIFIIYIVYTYIYIYIFWILKHFIIGVQCMALINKKDIQKNPFHENRVFWYLCSFSISLNPAQYICFDWAYMGVMFLDSSVK